MKIAIVVGHSKNSPGAYSKILGTSEYIYNSEVASYLAKDFDVYKRPITRKGGYMTQMRMLAEQLNPKEYDLVVELHFNKYDGKANNKGEGCEAIIYPNSSSRPYAQAFVDLITTKYQTVDRGVEEHGEGDRGFGFLSLMNAPAIIIEPFFGDEKEALKFKEEKEYAETIKKWLNCL